MTPLSSNDPAYDPRRARRRGHVESYFIKLNSPDGARAFWFKWTLFVPPGGPAWQESWAVVFERGRAPRAVKRSQPLSFEAISQSPFALDFAGQKFDGRRTQGQLQGAAMQLSWNVTLEPRLPPLVHLPVRWLYRTALPQTKLTSPMPDAVAQGEVQIDDERFDVTGWRAMQGHNWGRGHVHRYVWCHASGFDDADNVVFEWAAGRLAVGRLEAPWLCLAYLWIEGACVRFDSPGVLAHARCEASVMRAEFETAARGYRLRARIFAEPKETAGLHYANPRGAVTYCLNSKLASLHLELTGPMGAHTFRTSRAALELGWPTADHGVTMLA